MAPEAEHELLLEQTEGFKVGEKKTLDEYKNMGTCDLSSLNIKLSRLLSQFQLCLIVFASIFRLYSCLSGSKHVTLSPWS
jgi:hypothetical protein